MKRVIGSILGTVIGVVALLSFKTESKLPTAAGGLPSLGVSTAAPATSPTSTTDPTSTATGAPPRPAASSRSRAASAAAPSATSTSYTGAAKQTRYGVVQVKITVSATKVTKVTKVGFVQLTAFDDHSQQINSGAAPILLQETMKAQNANINSVSGASYTSAGYIQSLQSALDAAGIK